MIILKTSATISDVFANVIKSGKYEEIIYELMCRSEVVFPSKYQCYQEQAHGECDFLDMVKTKKNSKSASFIRGAVCPIYSEESRRSNAKYENNIRKERDRKEKQKIAAIKANLSDDDFGSDEYIDFDCPNCKYTLSYTKEEILSNDTLACPMCNCEMNVKSILK